MKAINPGTVVLIAILGFATTLTEEHRFATVSKIVDLLLGNTVLGCIIVIEGVVIWHLLVSPKATIHVLKSENDHLIEENKKLRTLLESQKQTSEEVQ